MIIGITDPALCSSRTEYITRIGEYLESDIDYLIIRDKTLDKKEYDKLIESVLSGYSHKKDKIIIHTHMDVAKKFGINNLHLPEKYKDICVDGSFELSYSLHPDAYFFLNDIAVSSAGNQPFNYRIDRNEVFHGVVNRAKFVLISPVFETVCKPWAKPLNKRLLEYLLDSYVDKVVLLGGLNKERIKLLRKIGFKHFAIRSGLNDFV